MAAFNDKVDNALKGWPEQSLTIGLLIVAFIAVIAAFVAPTSFKIILLAWLVAP